MTILALDIGSSSVRAILFENNEDGLALIPDAIVQRSYSFDSDEPGQATVNPAFLRELVEACMDEILQHPQAQTIEAVGMATFAGNLLVVDGENEPLSELYTYADTRGAQFIPDLREKINIKEAHQRTGTPLNTAYYPAQIPHFEYPHPAEPFLLGYYDSATYLYRHWFKAKSPMGYSVASWTGLFNRETCGWDKDWLTVLNVPEMLMPSLADYSQFQHGLTESYAKRWPQLADVPFYLALGDGAAAQVGSGAIAENTAALTVGTTAALRKVSTERLPPVPDGCWSYRIDKAHHLLGGALSEGGNIFAWAKETFNLSQVDIEAELQSREPASHGLTVLPLLNGERSPGWRGDATGTIHGLRLSTTPMDIVQALLEGVALRIARIAKQLELTEDVRIMASGGALQASPVWAQIIASALGHPLHLLDEPEITALGIAQLVRCAINKGKITGASPKISQIIKPKTNHSVIFEQEQVRQNALYRQLWLHQGL